jgi:hypothetical protein
MTTTKTGFFRSALNSMIDARARQATRYVNGALLMLDAEEERPRALHVLSATEDFERGSRGRPALAMRRLATAAFSAL